MKIKFIINLLIALSLPLELLQANDTCSRIALLNYQEILVDTNSTQKGEGLRYFLEKDPIAKKYLDEYQKRIKISWMNATLGTIGTLMLLSGLFVNNKSNRKSLIIGGSSIITVNFLVAKTIEHKNEINLTKAIDEYNKRNLPRIYYGEDFKNVSPSNNSGIYINFTKEF